MNIHKRLFVPSIVVIMIFIGFLLYINVSVEERLEVDKFSGTELEDKSEVALAANDFEDNFSEVTLDRTLIVDLLTERVQADIGDSITQIIEQRGDPFETGYYGGGPYYHFDDVTFFTAPESDTIVAMAFSGAELTSDEDKALEGFNHDEAILKGENEIDNYWVEIYVVNDVEVMIEREEENAEPSFVWLTEKQLFSE
ncbi:hypothetical protein [Salipaludibacillus daqingensis]|uniref:hypothetical protein n=1 Tax=Salipaludibacillus daqingensis TaxID=3041001 RepID=UPI0024756211|nr:hypothetical protein [Salipaludibacillus daqingensis]